MFNEETSSFVFPILAGCHFHQLFGGAFGFVVRGDGCLVCPQTFNQIKSQAKPEM